VTWLPGVAPARSRDDDALDRVFGLRPEAYARFRELYDGLWGHGVDDATLDLCQTRVQSLLTLQPDPTPAGVSTAQRACLAYAEQYVLDPHGLRDADFDALHEHYDDAALATLTLAVAMFDALARFSLALEV
jgi:alkylhydroperoxidase family enzyme